MSKPMTPFQYAKAETTQSRYPVITIVAIAGGYYLGDADWNLLTAKTFVSRDAATVERNRILDRTRKFIA